MNSNRQVCPDIVRENFEQKPLLCNAFNGHDLPAQHINAALSVGVLCAALAPADRVDRPYQPWLSG